MHRSFFLSIFCVLSEFFAFIGFARASFLLDRVLDTRDKGRDAVGQPLYPGLDLVGCLLHTRGVRTSTQKLRGSMRTAIDRRKKGPLEGTIGRGAFHLPFSALLIIPPEL